MKKIIFILFFCFSLFGVSANLAPPQALISELYFDSGNWILELGFIEYYDGVDSIKIETTAGISKIDHFTLFEGSGNYPFMTLIADSNLVNPLIFDTEGDFIKVISYAWGETLFDSLTFGNYPGSFLNCLLPGESYNYVTYYQGSGEVGGFCIDSSPTVGAYNDTLGVMCQFSGVIYDTIGYPFTGGYFPLPGVGNLKVYVNPDGSFSQRVLSRRYAFSTVHLYIPPWPYQQYWYNCEPVNFCIRPDSTHNQDIITINLITGVEEQPLNVNFVTVAPNPFSDHVVFYFNMNNNDDQNYHFSIYSLEGKMITQFPVSPGQNRFEWKPSVAITRGTYIYMLEQRHSIIKTGKFVKL